MSKTINLSRGFDSLSEEDKLYLAARGRLPKEHITDGIRTALNISGEASNVAYGAHTGTVATMTNAQLEAELEKRQAAAEKAFDAGKGDPAKALMPDLENPHSERLDYVEEAHAHKKESGEDGRRLAASVTAASGPSVSSLGAPGTSHRTEVTPDLDDDEEDDDEEGLSPDDYADAETSTTNAELRYEISRRNKERVEQGYEALSPDGPKATLVATLQADDEERGEEE